MLILPLSLENNATTTGTATICSKEFGAPCEHAKEYLLFEKKNTFNLDLAKKHHMFLSSLKVIKKKCVKLHILKNAEKAFDSNLIDDYEDEKGISENPPPQKIANRK